MNIRTIGDFRRAMRYGPYAWPGGYPCYFIMSDGEALSFATARTELRSILEALRDYHTNQREASGWRPVALDINYEDGALFCTHSGERIESAYAKEDAA